MKVSKWKSGEYIVTLHGHSFELIKLFGSKNWTLLNATGTEINQAETKSGMLEVMANWSPERTAQYAREEFCSYA